MSLQDLPNELFRPIIAHLVKEAGADGATRYRLVNKAFAVNIAECIIDYVSKVTINTISNHDVLVRLFRAQTGAILQKKLAHPGIETHGILMFTKDLINTAVNIRVPSAGSVRDQYTIDLCNTMGAVRPKVLTEHMTDTGKQDLILKKFPLQEILPAICSAIADVEILNKCIRNPNDIFKQANNIFPNALEAAIASGKSDILKKHLEYITKNVKGKPEAKDWNQMRTATKSLGKALSVAIRLRNDEARAMLFDFLDTNKSFRRSSPDYLGERLFNDAAKYGNKTLMYRSIEFYRNIRMFDEENCLKKDFILNADEMEILLRSGSKFILITLLQNGHIALNQSIDKMTPIRFALKNYRRDLASVMLANGANVDAVLSVSDRKTALWHAASNGHIGDVKFLLGHGAKPAYPGDDRSCPLRVAKKAQWRKCAFLLEKAS